MDVNQVLRTYGKHLQRNVRLKALAEDACSDKDAHEYAEEAAGVLCDVLKMYMDPATVTQEDAVEIFVAVMQKNYSGVANVCARVQNSMYRKAGVGLKALTPEFNAEKARGLATAITDAEEVTEEYLRGLVTNNALGVVDESIRINSKASEAVGLNVHIVRRYDDVGLHGGKDVCQWCMAREGDWNDYQEALDAGVFERHPGCGCVIEYQVGKTHTWSNTKGAWHDI